MRSEPASPPSTRPRSSATLPQSGVSTVHAVTNFSDIGGGGRAPDHEWPRGSDGQSTISGLQTAEGQRPVFGSPSADHGRPPTSTVPSGFPRSRRSPRGIGQCRLGRAVPEPGTKYRRTAAALHPRRRDHFPRRRRHTALVTSRTVQEVVDQLDPLGRRGRRGWFAGQRPLSPTPFPQCANARGIWRRW